VTSIEHGHLIDEPTMRLLVQKGAFLSTQAFIFFSDRGIVPPEQQPKLRQARDGADRMFALAKQLGAKVTFSTDMAGPLPWQAQQNRELTARLRWFTPAEILRQATSTSAALLALSGPRNPYEGRLGVIEPGALADLLLVAGDPLADLSLLERPAESLTAIVKDGRLVVAPREVVAAMPRVPLATPPAPPAPPAPAAGSPTATPPAN
jgi:imidazolonepropionase-like amidohydrolase